MKQIQTRVLSNTEIALHYYKMDLVWETGNDIPKPGQFMTIRVADSTVPLLCRPFAFSGYNREAGSVSLIYVKRGMGTDILTHVIPGEMIDLLGPLGNSLVSPPKEKKAILIAGGIGLGPILYFSSYLDAKAVDHRFIFGARGADFIPGAAALKDIWPETCTFVTCTDDGSQGFSGTVLDYLMTLPDRELSDTVVYCCGPEPMLKACHDFTQARDLECYVVMEQIMACGVGACMGCTIKVKNKTGFARVCMDGPVFESRDIVWT